MWALHKQLLDSPAICLPLSRIIYTHDITYTHVSRARHSVDTENFAPAVGPIAASHLHLCSMTRLPAQDSHWVLTHVCSPMVSPWQIANSQKEQKGIT